MFLSADKSGDGLLSVDEVFALMHKLNVKISYKKLRDIFKVSFVGSLGIFIVFILGYVCQAELEDIMEMRNLYRI